MNPLSIFFVLEQLSYNCHSRTGALRSAPQDDFYKRVLSAAKYLRKDLKKAEAIEQGLNIYQKRELSIHSIMDHLVQMDMVSIIHKQILLLPKGYEYLQNIYTDNYSAAYQAFRKEVLELLKQRNETEFTEDMISRLFFRKHSLDDISKIYFDKSNDAIAEFHSYIIKSMGKQIEDDSFVFHFCPQIFLPDEYIDENITLEVAGLDVSNNIIVGRPYPNKRYAVAGTKFNNTAIFSGYYPVITRKDKFPQAKKITMHWNVGNVLKVIHSITVKFNFDRGNFFSTDQSLSRGNSLKYLKLITTFEDDGYFEENRNFKRRQIGNEIYIEEDVTLTSFSMHLHNFHYSHSQFKKFKEQKIKI
ncbi:hypothetical protein ACOMCU_15895 [Lysinibacillus sp. UGB7]|uniref:hypothetical protein n=1 Tax=Lysinibacillus sp. UGB7 TaxID=3411039 RepID=UPI003B785AB0